MGTTTIPGAAHPNLGLGSLVMAGGVVGYLRKGSTPSLVAGMTFGSLLLGSGYMITTSDAQYEAHLLATTTSGLLSVGMGYRYVTTGYKFMPSGLVASLGAVVAAFNAKKALEWKP